MRVQWYVWIPFPWAHILRPAPYRHGRRYNLGAPRKSAPGWRARLEVWGMFAPKHGRLCWEVMR